MLWCKKVPYSYQIHLGYHVKAKRKLGVDKTSMKLLTTFLNPDPEVWVGSWSGVFSSDPGTLLLTIVSGSGKSQPRSVILLWSESGSSFSIDPVFLTGASESGQSQPGSVIQLWSESGPSFYMVGFRSSFNGRRIQMRTFSTGIRNPALIWIRVQFLSYLDPVNLNTDL